MFVVLPHKGDSKLYPLWVTGFVDGEGCFNVYISENKSYKLGWVVKPRFIIGLHVKDKPSLQQIQRTLGVVKLYQQGPSAIQLRVENIRELVPPPPPDRGGGEGRGGDLRGPGGDPPAGKSY